MSNQRKCLCVNNSNTPTTLAHDTGKELTTAASEQAQRFVECLSLLRELTHKVIDTVGIIWGDDDEADDRITDLLNKSVDLKTELHTLLCASIDSILAKNDS